MREIQTILKFVMQHSDALKERIEEMAYVG